jgi:tRNA C32,U32 (ribose-2'-O)-methylase TrmJ
MGIIQSLNISVACAVTIYEAMRQKQIAGHYNQPSLSEERREELMKDWSIPRKQKHDRQAMSKRKRNLDAQATSYKLQVTSWKGTSYKEQEK